MNFGGNSGRYSMRDHEKNIRVIDTRVHVGLVTRNIVIKGEGMKTSHIQKNEKYPEKCLSNEKKDTLDGEDTWQFGNVGSRGSANCMFRMGCVVNIDGVEMRNMGSPGNSGEYVFHFHCMGYAQSFNAYLPDYTGTDDVTSKRYANISNCSMVQCPSCLVVLHGTSEVVCKNNISLLSYNTAYCLESNGERFNRFEHQLSIGMMWSKDDNAFNAMFKSSVYWLKNSCNEVVRCVTCCSPRPMMGVWIIPQHISGMKNMSDICPGDKDLELPANITHEIMDGPWFGPNQFSWNPKTAWAPPSYYKKGLVNINNCAAYSHTNATNTVFPMLDNVFYNIAGGFTSYVACSPNVPCCTLVITHI